MQKTIQMNTPQKPTTNEHERKLSPSEKCLPLPWVSIPGGMGGYIPPNILGGGDGVYYHPPQYFTVECHIIPTNIWSTNKHNERNSKFWMQKMRKFSSLASLARIHRLSWCGCLAGSLWDVHSVVYRETAQNVSTLCNKVTDKHADKIRKYQLKHWKK